MAESKRSKNGYKVDGLVADAVDWVVVEVVQSRHFIKRRC